MAASDRQSESARATPRFAAIEPLGAVWLLRQLGRAGVDSAAVRRRAEWWRRNGYGLEADAVARCWDQLRAAAADAAGVRATSDSGSAEVDLAEVDQDLSQWMTTSEAATHLRCSSRFVRLLVEDGKLTGQRTGRAWQLDRRQVEELAELRQRRSA